MDVNLGGIRVQSDNGANGFAAVAALLGAIAVASSFLLDGWPRLGLVVVGGLLLLPIITLSAIFLAVSSALALSSSRPSRLQRTALGVCAVGLGCWIGSYAPGAPQEMLLAPLGLVQAGYLLRTADDRRLAKRRRSALALALVALSLGVTGGLLLWAL